MNDLISISKSKKIMAVFTAVMVAVLLLLSGFFIITHTEHECIDEDCPVCTQMESCEHEIRLYINRNNHSFISGRTRIMSGVFSQLKNPFK